MRRDHPSARATDAPRRTGRQWNQVAAMCGQRDSHAPRAGRWASGLASSGVWRTARAEPAVRCARTGAAQFARPMRSLSEGKVYRSPLWSGRVTRWYALGIARGGRRVWRSWLLGPRRPGRSGCGACSPCLHRGSSHRLPTSCSSSAACCQPGRCRSAALRTWTASRAATSRPYGHDVAAPRGAAPGAWLLEEAAE